MKKGKSPNDERLLIAGLKSGDQEAFRLLVKNYQVNIINTCMGFLRSDADADDVAQEVFIEAYKSIGKFRADANISTWLYRIAVNKSLNFLRSRKGRSHNSYQDISNTDRSSLISSGHSDEPDRKLTREEHARALEKALSGLPEKQRTAFILSKYEQLSHKEVAEIMNVTYSSVESLLFRAKSNLQVKLFEYYKNNVL